MPLFNSSKLCDYNVFGRVGASQGRTHSLKISIDHRLISKFPPLIWCMDISSGLSEKCHSSERRSGTIPIFTQKSRPKNKLLGSSGITITSKTITLSLTFIGMVHFPILLQDCPLATVTLLVLLESNGIPSFFINSQPSCPTTVSEAPESNKPSKVMPKISTFRYGLSSPLTWSSMKSSMELIRLAEASKGTLPARLPRSVFGRFPKENNRDMSLLCTLPFCI